MMRLSSNSKGRNSRTAVRMLQVLVVLSGSTTMPRTTRTTTTLTCAQAFSSTTVPVPLPVGKRSHPPVVPRETSQTIEGLEPVELWKHFAILSSIPRPSKQEEAVLQYLQDFADSHNHLSWKQDKVGNLVIFHPGCGNGQQAPPVMLQGHVDMVTEKNAATDHNFETDPILLQRIAQTTETEDSTNTNTNTKTHSWLGAKGTTLGADNGIGVAAALALLELDPQKTGTSVDIIMPPLQALFTVDEETGLTGATDLDVEALGLTATTMLNLDTEEWGELYVGCAGGGESILTLPLERRTNAATKSTLVEVSVQGLLGGHSGINIHEGRGNAVLLCAHTVQKALVTIPGVSLVSLQGGDKHNAIPREAKAILVIDNDDDDDDAASSIEAMTKLVQEAQKAAIAEYGSLETGLQVQVTTVDDGEFCSSSSTPPPLNEASAKTLLAMVLALPHGAIKYSHAIPDLVETSNNVASLQLVTTPEGKDRAVLLTSTRSSIATALETIRDKIASIADLAGASVEQTPAYPGWNPNMNSPLLNMAKTILTRKLQVDATTTANGESTATVGVKAIHAGLECGLLIEKLGGDVDALSFGPTITGAHSPDERIAIDTVPPFFELVQELLTELAQKRV